MPKADLATAERVETIGRKIIAQNTFPGIEPLFHTVGVPESVLFHRGTEELFVSEGLIKKCKTDGELAAVLCSELGQMIAEKKSARRSGRTATPSRISAYPPIPARRAVLRMTRPALPSVPSWRNSASRIALAKPPSPARWPPT